MKSYCTINTLFDIKTLFHLYKFFKILNKEKKVAEVYQLRFISANPKSTSVQNVAITSK